MSQVTGHTESEANAAYKAAVIHLVAHGGQLFNFEARQLLADAIVKIRRLDMKAGRWWAKTLFGLSGYPTKDPLADPTLRAEPSRVYDPRSSSPGTVKECVVCGNADHPSRVCDQCGAFWCPTDTPGECTFCKVAA